MKELFQKEGDTVVVNGDICMTVLEIDGDEVVLEIKAPDWVEVLRTERYEDQEECASLQPR